MEQYELLGLVFTAGVTLPLTLLFVYWFAVDSAKRYVDSEIRKAKL